MNFDYIGNEYAWIERQFGKQGVDWTRELQSLIEKDGKYLDSIRIRSLRDGKRYDILFDVTGPFVSNVGELGGKIRGQVGCCGHLGVADEFPTVKANENAQAVLQNCEKYFQQGVMDTQKGTFNEDMVTSIGGALPAHQLELYRVVYRLGRYGEMFGWPEAKKQSWAHEVGRAVTIGLDDALAGRSRGTSYAAYDSSQWSQDDLAVLMNAYYSGFTAGQDLAPGKSWKLALGVTAALAAGFGGVYLWQKYKTKDETQGAPVGAMATANPSWDLQNARSRDEYRQFRMAELQAIVDGRWPRDTNDIMRWNPRTAEDREHPAKYVERVIRQDLKWLDDLERRISRGDPDLSSYEPRPNPSHGKDRPMTVQTLLFDKEMWSVQEAKDWAKAHGNKYGSVDVKGRNIRLRQNDPSAFQKGSYATIPFGEGTGIQAVVARPKR